MTTHPSSGRQTTHEREDAQVSRILTWLSLAAILSLTGIASQAWHSGHSNHALILLAFIVPVLANMAWFACTGNRDWQKVGLLIIASVLFTYLIASGGESNTGPLWFYVFPPLLFFLTNLKTGTMILLLVYLVAIIIFQFPNLPFVFAEYESDFKIRFFATLTFESIFCFVLETSRLKARNELLDLAQTHERAAKTDELTNLSNRRDILNRLSEEYSRYQRSGHHFSIALIDLDLFKNINDQYGHDAGDAALKQFADLVQTVIRQTDVAARWGGEEFLLLLPDTSLIPALTLAERLRSEIARNNFSFQGQELPVTMSAGVCTIAQADSIDSMLRQADLQLYNAKEAGRNRIAPRVRNQNTVAEGQPSS
ncbi:MULTISPECIES: GGDEF domain-containing protein [unclassified Marinobacter]|uniref:GGDEF domain-containing protein n=1 Tax=unclassified Marinobacter TaxID=83889 RepID=UPI0026E41EFB|nr:MULTISPECIES: GGDEF domain-containing protein [unclassified Marinobacter]MDO6441467.1 GGDEF domain-containing protein [Marinobacter sp. 2_MG-2023]MDO6822370.1 GGDEF domain-containing protein [Marinobacter sp. 1_MG-2023]